MLFFFFFFFFLFFYLFQRDTDSAARVHRITAINYESERPKEIEKEREWEREKGRKKKEAEKRKKKNGRSSLCTQFPRGQAAPLSLRENKVSLRGECTHVARCNAEKKRENGEESAVARFLINISSGFETRLNWQRGFVCYRLVSSFFHAFSLCFLRAIFYHSCSDYVKCKDYFFRVIWSISATVFSLLLIYYIYKITLRERNYKLIRYLYMLSLYLWINEKIE